MLHPDYLSDLAALQHQDRLRDVEIWRLQQQARGNLAIFLQHLLHRLIVAASRWPGAIQHQVRKMSNSTLLPGITHLPKEHLGLTFGRKGK
jgi:hypothetical protein